MKILIDTDVLLDVALEREPHVEASAAVLDLIEAGAAAGFVTSHSLATFYYLLDSRGPGAKAVDMIRDLLSFVEVASLDTRSMQEAIELPLRDFEDAMQAIAASKAHCDVIATRNIKDFKHSPARAVLPKRLLLEIRG